MFRFVHRNLQHHIRIRKQTTIHVYNVYIVVVLHQCQNPHLKSFSNISESKNPSSITVDYLINSCGFPPETALSTSKKIHLSSTKKLDSVLTFFQNHGFTKTQSTQLISKYPYLLLYDPIKNYTPKIDFFHDLGFSGPNIVELLAYDPSLMTRSLQNHIIPNFNFLKSFLGSNDILTAFRRLPWMLRYNLDKLMGPNIEILRAQGVSECSISKLLRRQPMRLMQDTNLFKDFLEVVKKMGFDSSTPGFVRAVQVMKGMSKSSWDGKLAVYRSLGLSEDEILLVFKRQPVCMAVSKEKIQRGAEFFMNKLKWESADIALHPGVLLFNLDKWIVPRCAVLEILNSKGMIKKKVKVTSVFALTVKDFEAKYVTKYHETNPEVVITYKGEIVFTGCEERRMWWG